MSKNTIPNLPGICQKCGIGDFIQYADMELEGEQLYYEVSCFKCGWKGKEWYSLEFIEMTSNDEE